MGCEMSEEVEPYLGLWTLVPGAAGDGGGPAAAVYTMLHDAEGLYTHVRWHDADGAVRQSASRSVVDGVRHALEGGMAMCSSVDERGLITEVFRDDQAVARMSLALRPDGGLEVVQSNRVAEGWQEMASLYRRTSAKQVLVYRRDLKMRKGKIAAQCAHGAMAVFFRGAVGPAQRLEIELDGPMAVWSRGGFAKVVLSCEDEEALLLIAEHARHRGLPHAVITDAGRTEFHGVPTRTVVAIGPAAVEEIDPITGREGVVACKLA